MLASILDVGQSLVNLPAAGIAHPDHCCSRPFLDLPDFSKRSEQGIRLVLHFIEVRQFHAPLVAGSPFAIVDVEKISRHDRSDLLDSDLSKHHRKILLSLTCNMHISD